MILSVKFSSSCILPSKRTGNLLPVSSLSFKSPVLANRNVVSMACSTEASTFRIQETFSNLKKKGKVAFIPFITAGDPDLKTTEEALKLLDAYGSDIIELGIPYCDQLADGPVIQAAAARSLARGTTMNSVLSMLEKVTPQLSSPVVVFTYYNPILKRGVDVFMSSLRKAGVHGILVPDVPLEETDMLRAEAAKNQLELVLLTTPTTPLERMESIAVASQGFVYLVSFVGVTGTRENVSSRLQTLLSDLKQCTSKPVAVGFGISTPEHVKQVAAWGADGVIVGSAMVKTLGEANTPEEGLHNLEVLVKSLKAPLL